MKLDGFLTKVELIRSKCDPCAYIKSNTIIAVYVEDLLISYKHVSELNDYRGLPYTNFE